MTTEKAQELYPDLDIIQIIEDEKLITVYSKCSTKIKNCSFCGIPSQRIHKKYTRTLQDLPIDGKAVKLVFDGRIFRCDNEMCNHKSFMESIECAEPYTFKTKRLISYILDVVGQLPYRKAETVLQQEGIIIDGTTANKLKIRTRKKG